MVIKLPFDINQTSVAGKAALIPFDLKLNQRLDAKVVDNRSPLNTLVLQVDDKSMLVESQHAATLTAGQALQLQVVKLLPSPEFKVIAPTLPQTDNQAPPQTVDTPTLKLLNAQANSITETSLPYVTQPGSDRPSIVIALNSVLDFLDADAEQRLIQTLRLLLQRIQESPSSISANTPSTLKNEAAMDINLSLDVSLQQATAKIANNLDLKLNQLISAKVIDTQIMLNTLTLSVANKNLVVQGQQASSLQAGQTLQLQVVKLLPTPEFKIVATVASQTNTAETANTQTLKLLNVTPQAPTAASAKIALSQLVAGQQLQASIVKIADHKVTLQLLAPSAPAATPGQATTNAANMLITVDAKQLVLAAGENATKTSSFNTPLPTQQTTAFKGPALPMLTMGDQISLQVLKPGAAPTFGVTIPMFNTEQKLVELFKQLLPIQTSTAPLLNHLTQILPALENDASVAETLKRLAQEILRSIPLKTQLTESSQLKQSVDQSGLFLESKLAELLSGKSAISLQQDMKLKLVKFVHLLTAEITAQAKQDNTELLKDTLQKTQNALAKLTLDQFSSLPRDESPKQGWVLELPFFHEHKADNVRIEIEQDKQGDKNSAQKNWAVSITITPPELATIYCRISCYDGAVNTRFWSDGPDTVDKINTHLDFLKQQLEQKGLKTGFMEAHQGKPSQTESAKKPLSNLLSEKV